MVRGTTSKFGKERVHREASFTSVNLMSADRAIPKFEEKTQHETLHQEQHARGVAYDLAKISFNSKKGQKLRSSHLQKFGH